MLHAYLYHESSESAVYRYVKIAFRHLVLYKKTSPTQPIDYQSPVTGIKLDNTDCA